MLDLGYECVRSGGTKVLNLWCEGVRSDVREVLVPLSSGVRVLFPGYDD